MTESRLPSVSWPESPAKSGSLSALVELTQPSNVALEKVTAT